jgi:uncharacterized protein YsxB (DUF464 family)
LDVKGHAGLAPQGEDIVCSAVSILVYTLVRAIEGMVERDELNDTTVVKLESGDTSISISPRFIYRREARLIFDTICDGFELIAHDYPQYVVLESI